MISILFSLIFLLPTSATEWSSPEEQARAQSLPAGLIVDLKAQKPTCTVGDRILVDVQLSNAGNRVIQISAIMAPQFHWVAFDVRDRHGKEVAFIGPNLKLNLKG